MLYEAIPSGWRKRYVAQRCAVCCSPKHLSQFNQLGPGCHWCTSQQTKDFSISAFCFFCFYCLMKKGMLPKLSAGSMPVQISKSFPDLAWWFEGGLGLSGRAGKSLRRSTAAPEDGRNGRNGNRRPGNLALTLELRQETATWNNYHQTIKYAIDNQQQPPTTARIFLHYRYC